MEGDPMTNSAAILLVGGESRRMGQDKAHLTLGTTSFAAQIADTLRSVTGRVIVVRSAGQALPEDLSADRIVDDPTEGAGPLVALTAGLQALDGVAEIAFAASVDTPFLKPDLVREVLRTLLAAPEVDAVAPRVAAQVHPLAAAYRVSLAGRAAKLTGAGRRRLQDLLETCETRYLPAESLRRSDPDLASLININTPAQLRAARERKR